MVTELKNEDISHLEGIMLKDGILQVVDYERIKDFTTNQMCLFCVRHAVYQIVTTELVNFIKGEIGTKKAIEIGGGNGCLGRALGIPVTDLKAQENSDVQAMYRLMQQPVITYGQDVVKMEAMDAISTYAPDVVVSAWVTQRWKPGIKHGFDRGVSETYYKGKIEKYIFVGNEGPHGDKEIMKMYPVKKYKFDWLVSRSWYKGKNCIWVFDCA